MSYYIRKKINTIKIIIPYKHSYYLGKSFGTLNYNYQNYDSSIKLDPKKESNKSYYKGHIKISSCQKILLTIGSSFVSLIDPRRHDMIAILGETTGHSALSKIYSNMLKDDEGSIILMEKPRINSKTVNIQELAFLPKNTLGYHYYTFLNDNKVTPDSRLPVRYIDNIELAYVMQRYREVHDIFHTVLGMPTNLQGEVAVKWIETLQLGLPMCISGAIFGPLRFKAKQRQNYLTKYLPWALRVGQNAKPLINVYFENRWNQDISDLRSELNIDAFVS